jgi:hypothetical protein
MGLEPRGSFPMRYVGLAVKPQNNGVATVVPARHSCRAGRERVSQNNRIKSGRNVVPDLIRDPGDLEKPESPSSRG